MTPHVEVKGGVRLCPLTPALVRLLAATDRAALEAGVVLTVTCGREGHPYDDPHTRGQAIDLRVRDLTLAQIVTVYQSLVAALSPTFTVLYEVQRAPGIEIPISYYVNPKATAAHLHLQARKGTDWPPAEEPELGSVA